MALVYLDDGTPLAFLTTTEFALTVSDGVTIDGSFLDDWYTSHHW